MSTTQLRQDRTELLKEIENLRKRVQELENAGATSDGEGRVPQGQGDDRYRRMIEFVPEAVCVFLDERCVFINAHGVGMFGAKTADELLGRTIWDFIHPNYRDSGKSQYTQCLDGNDFLPPVEFGLIRLNGEGIPVESSARPITYDGRRAVLAVWKDISDRRQIEDALGETKKRFRNLVKSAPIGIFTTTSGGKVLAINLAMARILGCASIEEALERYKDLSVDLYAHPERRDEFMRQLRESGRVENFEYQAHAADGRVIWLNMNARIAGHTGDDSSNIEGFTNDITERKWTEEALVQSEELYRGIFENASIGITRVSLDGIYREVNPAMTRILGYGPAELTGRPVADFTYPEDLGRRAQFVSDLIEGRIISGEQERRFVHRNGSLVWTLISASVQRDQSGKPLFFISLVQDITDRKLAETELRNSEARYRTLIENIPQAVVLKDRESKYISINTAYALAFGLRQEEVIGKTDYDFHPEDLADKFRQEDRLVMETGESREFDEEYARDGKTCFYHKVKVSVRDSMDKITGVLATLSDITEHKLADEKLRETEKKYRELAESLPQVIFEVDLNGMLTYVNQTGHQLFGYTPEEIAKGFNVLEAFIPEDRERIALDLMLNIQGQRLGRLDYTALRKDGTQFPAGVHAGPVRSGQTATGVRGILIDLTETQRAYEEKKKLETQLRQAQKMEAIGSLAGGIAHDFNNILSVIIGNAEILQMSDVSADAKDGLYQIFAASQRAKQLVRQILAFSRQGEQQKLLMNLKPVIKETLDFLRASIPSTIKLQHHIKSDAGAILADATQMQQVLMNLCTNAAHAMEEEGGVLKIELDTVTIDEEDVRLDPEVERGEYLRLTVSDTGHGIDSGVLHRIFDPYFTTKGPDKGTGLGLAVVHGIVTSHGGVIRVSSELGKGTVFHVLLPRADAALKKEEKAVQPLPAGTERILVVDDEKPLADVYQRMLSMLGYRVETRTSPVEALEAVRMNPQKYDLVDHRYDYATDDRV